MESLKRPIKVRGHVEKKATSADNERAIGTRPNEWNEWEMNSTQWNE